jgi:hypothetical protein
MEINAAQYTVLTPDGLATRIAGFQRRRMFVRFLHDCGVQPTDTLVDVGATSDRSHEHSNYLEAWYPHKDKLTAVGVDDASFLEQLYPGVSFKQADGRSLPFADASFDFAHSSAVIEHVGSRAQQTQLLGELWRVCRKGMFITTPNRWFPVEFHTSLPLLHWLPPAAFRGVLRAAGYKMLAEEANLNLLSRRDLRELARAAGIAGATVDGVRLGGWTSNLLLVALKVRSGSTAG